MKKSLTSIAPMAAAICAAFGLAVSAPSAARAADKETCSISFNLLDENGDGMIDRGEATEGQRKVFATLDRDGDTILTREEYELCLSHSASLYGYGRPILRADATFAEIDRDGDRRLSRAEFLAAGEARYRALLTSLGDAPANAARYDGAMKELSWSIANPDIDGDGRVLAMEAAADVDETFRALDRNRDGFVTADEWVDNDWALRMREAYQRMDLDKDGKISMDEYVAANPAAGPPPVAGQQGMSPWEYRLRYY